MLRIYQILHKYSDEEHPLKQADIQQYLLDEYNIEIERKAVSRNINTLRESGFDIESTRKGSWLASREFTDAEIRILIDGVISGRYISEKYSKDLIDKLCGLSNCYFKPHGKYVQSLSEWKKTGNRQLFLNIDLIEEAIEKNLKITFEYRRFDTDLKPIKGYRHTVTPYQMVIKNQQYYLICKSDKYENMSFFRMDRISDIKIEDDMPAYPIRNVKGYRNGIDFGTIANSLPYMFSDEPELIVFEADPSIVDQVYDWFGSSMDITKKDDKTVEIRVTASPSAMEYWSLQYLNYVKVKAPEHLVETLKKDLKKGYDKYRK